MSANKSFTRLDICDTCAMRCFPSLAGLYDLHKRHMDLMCSTEVYIPKHHLAANAWYQGNPLRDQNFFDEALNKTLKAVCRNASQLNFEATVFSKMLELLSKPPESLKRTQRAS